MVAEALARRNDRPKVKGVVGLLDRSRVLLSGCGSVTPTICAGPAAASMVGLVMVGGCLWAIALVRRVVFAQALSRDAGVRCPALGRLVL
jgi:hypothetical protein